MSKTCSAFGHRETYAKIKEPLTAILEQLITEQDVSCFYTGGMGEFDSIFSSTVRILKRVHPQVRLYLVLPYYTANINKERTFLKASTTDWCSRLLWTDCITNLPSRLETVG